MYKRKNYVCFQERTESKFGVESINTIYLNLIRGDQVVSISFFECK